MAKAIELFAGVGGFRLGLEQAGIKVVWANEWDSFAAQTYNKNFKDGINTDDITTISTDQIPAHDLLTGGFPCQAFSIAGKRHGFNETRGTLFFDIARILADKKPGHILLENVKGLLTHDTGKTFQVILGVLADLGYRVEWMVLNSKDFGVPQNRERVFIVGHIANRCAGQVFPLGQDDQTHNNGNQKPQAQVARPLRASASPKSDSDYIVHNIYGGFKEQRPRVFDKVSPTIRTPQGGGHIPMVVTGSPKYKNGKRFMDYKVTDQVPTIRATQHKSGDNQPKIFDGGVKVRRLTPVECERLQGFPDGWTEGVSDTQRYKQMGNAVTVNVVATIAKKLAKECL